MARIYQIQTDHAMAHQERLAGDTSNLIAEAIAVGRKRLRHQLRLAVIVAGMMAVLVVTGTAWYTYQQHLRREWLATQYHIARTCLDNGDYLCARDGFVAILQVESNYSEASIHLDEARYELAQQYAQAGQWESAVTELDLLLKDYPADQRALKLLEETYDRWLLDAMGHGDWVTALKIKMQQEARFPSATQQE
ncbi:MAG: hypothetical protein KJ077_27915 [Anaerolineae bacterium]|nr:hypothetical protein [Anaerolineae bacterium]